jgi:hypothetical protein
MRANPIVASHSTRVFFKDVLVGPSLALCQNPLDTCVSDWSSCIYKLNLSISANSKSSLSLSISLDLSL